MVEFRQSGLAIRLAPDRTVVWAYDRVREMGDGAVALRLGREEHGTDTGERLEIADPAAAEPLRRHCAFLAGDRQTGRRTLLAIAGWSLAAVVSLALLVVYGVPALADRIAPLVPWSTEVQLGQPVEGEALRSLAGPSARMCGEGTAPSFGRQALDRLVRRLSAGADLPGELRVSVVDSDIRNAFALPGGRILLFRGLIETAKGPDEVAGVLAHEIGHVVHRDAMRRMIHAGGLSFVVGTVLGDFTGAGALVIATKFMLGNSYSRQAETEADLFAAEAMARAGGDVTALARFLERVATMPGERQLELLLSHPVTEDRVRAIEAMARGSARRPILDPEEWNALRAICAR
jgi:Zn-dependent protease with chaperone function